MRRPLHSIVLTHRSDPVAIELLHRTGRGIIRQRLLEQQCIPSSHGGVNRTHRNQAGLDELDLLGDVRTRRPGTRRLMLTGELSSAIHERATGTLTQLEDKYDARIKERQKTYRNQIEVQAQALSDQGHLDTANDLHSALRPLKPDLKAFLRLLYPRNPDRGTLPWEPRRDLPGKNE